ELRSRKEQEGLLRRTVRDLKKHPVLDAGIKGFHASTRNRAMSNPESPVRPVNVVSFPPAELANDFQTKNDRILNFDLGVDLIEDNEESVISSDDGMSDQD